MLFLEERLGRLLSELKGLCVLESAKVSDLRTREGEERELNAALNAPGWEDFGEEDRWGGKGESYRWFTANVTIPASMEGRLVRFALETGCEGWDAVNPQFAVYVDGVLEQGLDVNHRDVTLTDCAKAGEHYAIALRAYSGTEKQSSLMLTALEAIDRETQRYYWDLKAPLDAARLMEKDTESYLTIIGALNESVNMLDLRKPRSEEYYASLHRAQENITREFYEKKCGESRQTVYAVGHTHIDVAWLWTLKVTQDKAVRSFSTVTRYMEEYPDYIFMSSQPQLYKYVQKYAPEVFARIRARVLEGRWEPEGAMFLEADCNLSSGESLVRQIVHGKRYFRKEFDRDNIILWLPDVFGYSAALPQILEKSGVKYFMTTKISWNEVNKLPYDTFMWEGIDGTRVLTHFSPSRDYNRKTGQDSRDNTCFTTYNAMLDPKQVMGAWQRYQQKDLNNEVLMSFGYGDGGGGPTREMLEYYKRLEKGIPGCPRAKMSDSRTFFEDLEENVKRSRFLPSWVGELYLEYHRGTYTGMARNKRFNRKGEFALENAELYSSSAAMLTKAAYPQERLLAGWEVLERNQFHDILPGSSIQPVYEDSKKEYEGLLQETEDVTKDALKTLTRHISASEGSLIVFNPSSYTSDECVYFDWPQDEACAVYDGDRLLPTQRAADGRMVFCLGAIPPKGYKTFALRREDAEKGTITLSGQALETPFYRVSFNEKGQLTSLFDKRAGRQVLKSGQVGNQLMSYEDKPHNYDAWDVNNYYTEKSWPIDNLTSMEVIESGPVRTCIRLVYAYLDSTWTQVISFYEQSPRVDFDNDVDWKEHQIFVKTLFPVDVHSSEATYEIQYGHVKRPTHYNTSWDAARFEVCHHKWLDFSEDGYGVSLLNDCKYGVNVHDGVIGLSLLKCALHPNPAADKERHSFRYSLMPHQGSWRDAGTLENAYAINNSPRAILKDSPAGKLPPRWSLVQSESPNVVIEVVKRAEDSQDTVVRVYEAFGRRSRAALSFGQTPVCAAECNLMEEEDAPLTLDGAKLPFTIKPFEIKTFKIRFAQE